ncbi:MAG TPA: hypothetical protein VFO29_09700 [Candidatus Rubrimentiphilum sp.]|nr:hypothetical protein [Candidatus Rubrimentiphilum sp.]
MRRQLIGTVATVFGVVIALVVMQNIVMWKYFPHLDRMTTDFSAAYLQRELESMAASPPQVVFLGDSVLWGFYLKANQNAISILASQGCRCRNLSFKASSPPNYYALANLLLRYGVRPKLVVLEIDQRVLNPVNNAYSRLHPAVADLASPLLSSADRKLLIPPAQDNSLEIRLGRVASALSVLYAMRADLREMLQPVPDTLPVRHPTADLFEGEYDLTPLTDGNVGVRYLEKTVDALRRARIPIVAFMTPTNHTLLHSYIDGPEYGENLRFLQRMLERHGARVLNLDRAFSGKDFYDYAHLRATAQIRLAQILGRELPR